MAIVDGLLFMLAWNIRKEFWQDRGGYEEKLRQALLSREVPRQRHTGNVANPVRIDPDTWTDEFAFLDHFPPFPQYLKNPRRQVFPNPASDNTAL
jgi:hypothetical protein